MSERVSVSIFSLVHRAYAAILRKDGFAPAWVPGIRPAISHRIRIARQYAHSGQSQVVLESLLIGTYDGVAIPIYDVLGTFCEYRQ